MTDQPDDFRDYRDPLAEHLAATGMLGILGTTAFVVVIAGVILFTVWLAVAEGL